MKHIVTTALAVLLLTACSTVKTTPLVAPEGMDRELKAAGLNVGELDAKHADKVATEVAKQYKPWTALSMKGKLSLDALPVTPNVKVYMEHAQCIRIAVSWGILGEVARIEIDRQNMTLINKRGGTYCRVPIADKLSRLGADITNVQDLLLGRVFLMNAGTLTAQTAPLVNVSQGSADTWIITPKHADPNAEYGFTLYPDGKMLLAAAFTPDEQYQATAQYSYQGKKSKKEDNEKTTIDLALKLGSKPMNLSLQLDPPVQNPEAPLQPTAIKKDWQQLSLKAFIKSLL